MPTYNNKPSNAPNAFTLIELLIVIAILGGLAGLFVMTFPASQRRARDTQRRSDIKQYQTAFEVYANTHDGNYFDTSGPKILVNQCVVNKLNLDYCPEDPDGTPRYLVRASTSEYALSARLEQPDDSGDPQFFIACSNGRSGIGAARPSSTTCPI